MYASGRALAVLILVSTAACSSAPLSPPPAATFPPAASPALGPTATPSPIVPGGLMDRPRLPDLVDGEADPCLPLCATGLTRPNRVLNPGSRYQTTWFFGGYMTVTPTIGITILEDSTGSLAIELPGQEADYHAGFALDVYPVKDGVRVPGIPQTADGLIGWLRDHEHYEISDEMPATIGSIPATAIDVWLAPGAPEQYADCGAPCVDMFSFEQWSDNGGIRGTDRYRLYLADVVYGGTAHVLTFEVQAVSTDHLSSMQPAIEGLLAGVTVPARTPRA
jgi:hypothetical protein